MEDINEYVNKNKDNKMSDKCVNESKPKQQQLPSYLCIDYPGYVENPSNAIQTLGGLERIEKAFFSRNGKLFLNYNPNNIFSKVLCSSEIDNINQTNIATTSRAKINENQEFNSNETTSSNSCLLLKIIKKKTPAGTTATPSKAIYESKLIGKIEKIFTFRKLADFQYLPMSKVDEPPEGASNKTDNVKYEGFYKNFHFDQIDDFKQDLKSKMPLYVLPPFFSRFDDAVNYAFKPEPNKKVVNSLEYFNSTLNDTTASTGAAATATSGKNKTADESINLSDSNLDDSKLVGDESEIASNIDNADDSFSSDLIRSVRQERSSQALLITFDCTNVPDKPCDKLKKPRNESVIKCIETLDELFAKRPCYLKSVLLCITNYPQSILKEALPYKSYYFTTGPWRSCWVRYGYDPRKHPECKEYQMIDYRLRYFTEPESSIVKAKPRSSYHKRKFRNDFSENDVEDYKNIKIEETMYKFKQDQLPSSRNVFYQICDIEDDEVQQLVHSNDGTEKECTEKDGWCCANIQDKCRNIMSAKHEKLFKYLTSKQNESKKQTNNS